MTELTEPLGLSELESLVEQDKKLHEQVFDELMNFIRSNELLREKIVIGGTTKNNKKRKNTKYYLHKGYLIAGKKGLSERHWDSHHVAHPGLTDSWFEKMYYIPNTDKFISVEVKDTYGRTRAGSHYSSTTYKEIRELDKNEIMPLVDRVWLLETIKSFLEE